ncbi:hypothetical protein DSO57_1001539 [Entomophthora muscae]|uniref:Uncharacterized protein n=1 Tax=Entomophthora muscae TaxID=34485 RepID=A0ACC2RNX9_9FUNG|nr:hypothetical protein DSO57_1001539 [Entomophthora muscae]
MITEGPISPALEKTIHLPVTLAPAEIVHLSSRLISQVHTTSGFLSALREIFLLGPNSSVPTDPIILNPHGPRHHYEHPQYYNRPHSPHYEQPRSFHGHRPHFNPNVHPNGANFSPNHFGSGPRTPPYPNPHSFHHDHMGPPMGGPPGDHHHLNGPEMHSSSFPHMPGFSAPMSVGPGENLPLDPNLIKTLIDSGIINLGAGSFRPQHPILPEVEPFSDAAPAFNVSSLAALEDKQSMIPPINVAPIPKPLSVSLTQKDINLYVYLSNLFHW